MLSSDIQPVEPLLSGNLTLPALASNIRSGDLRLAASIAQIYKPYVLLSANVLRGEFLHGGATLDCCFHDDTSGFSVSAYNTVTRENLLGCHDAPVRCIEYSSALG
ncbi:unnamed protein product [Lactuca saligna]|uniref:Uncharacterized protein n=1 Tax=Lactuca saligna TaxID=75948 RepID=A0AA35YWI5_LACSI|nr:unnamed protein product [Lactuca saligna]